jgi:hypothetical protein
VRFTDALNAHVMVPVADVPDNPVAEPHEVGELRFEFDE